MSNTCKTNFEFLGTIAGRQAYTSFQGKQTYSRILDSEVLLAFCVDDLRTKISPGGPFTRPDFYKMIGNDYNYPRDLSPMQGGGYFKTLSITENGLKDLTRHAYTMNRLGNQLEKMTGLTLKTIQHQLQSYGIQYFVNRFFDCVLIPKDGDLVVYYDSYGKPVHSGIFRDSQPNWNSPRGGTVESKWDDGFKASPYTFQHDFFFLPQHYGNVAKIYRIIEEARPSPTPIKHVESSGPMYTQMSDRNGSFCYISNEANNNIRTIISSLGGNDLTAKLPQIDCIDDIGFCGVCYEYALEKIFGENYPKLPSDLQEADLINSNNSEILNKYFTPAEHPQVGDLAVYSNSINGGRVHFGVYVAEDLIESKWGKHGVYRHPPFYVDFRYGDTITYYRLKADW